MEQHEDNKKEDVSSGQKNAAHPMKANVFRRFKKQLFEPKSSIAWKPNRKESELG